MTAIVHTVNLIFGFVFYPLEKLPAIWGLVGVSLLTAIIMLVIFRYTSNQQAIKRTKNKIKAYILEIRIYKDHPGAILKALGKILRFNLDYLRYGLLPLAAVIVPVILILIQLNFRYGYRPLRAGESTVVKVKLHDKVPGEGVDVSLNVPESIRIETLPLRIKEQREVDWRIRLTKRGSYELTVTTANEQVQKSVYVGDGLVVVSPARVSPAKVLFKPTEAPLPKRSDIESIEVKYPTRRIKVLGRRIHWLVIFFVGTIFFGFILKGPMKVEI